MEKGVGKSRKAGILRSVMTKTPIREGRESQRERTWDAKSDTNSDTMLHQSRAIENTYKVAPDYDKRFQVSKVETVMRDTLKEFLTDVEYEKTLGQRMSKLLSDTIKTRIKEFKMPRYKIVVHIIIGENNDQDIRAGSRFLWNEETDTYACAKYVNKSLFALAVCFGVYFD